MGLASEAKILRSEDIPTIPRVMESIILQEPIPVAIRMAAPIKQASVEVSPIDPGINPRKESHHE
jgi:hypothetical protein